MRIAYTRPDGGVSVVHAVPRKQLERALGAFADDDAYRQHVFERSIPPDARDVTLLPDDYELPARCELRDGWALDRGRVMFDLAKCREIWRRKIRAARAPLLAALDVDYQRADERGDAEAKRAIAARKQSLRDAPADPAIDAAATVEQLRAVWPEALGKAAR